MNLVKKKLNSKRGASMILVLSLFLICVMVSSVILAAASSGLSRNAQRVQQQRGYLAVSSASDLIVKELKTLGKYIGVKKISRYCCEDCTIEATIYDEEGNPHSGVRLDAEYIVGEESHPLDDGHVLIIDEEAGYVIHEPEEAPATHDCSGLRGVFNNVFARGCAQIFETGMIYEETIKFDLSVDGSTDERISEVICYFTMDDEYNVKFLLTTEESGYAVSISCSAKVENSSSPVNREFIDNHKHLIYYKDFDEETRMYSTQSVEWKIPIEITTMNTTVEWDGPRIVKEVLSQ